MVSMRGDCSRDEVIMGNKKSEIKKTSFSYYAPFSSKVTVAGSFNDWNPETWELTKNGKGNWAGKFEIEPGRYEYRFVVDGNWENDQNNNEIVPNSLGTFNNVLVVR